MTTDTDELVSSSTFSEEKKPLSLFLADGLTDRGSETNTDFDLIDHHLRKFDRQTTNLSDNSHFSKMKLRKLRPIAEESPPPEPLSEELLRLDRIDDAPEPASTIQPVEKSPMELFREVTSLPPSSFVLPVIQKKFLSGTVFLDSFSNDDFTLFDYLVEKIRL